MKRVLPVALALALVLCLIPICAPATTADSPILLGGTGDDACFGTLPLPDGSLILSLSSGGGRGAMKEYAKNVHKVWLLCLAPDGTTVWETDFGADDPGGHTVLQRLTLGGDGTFSGTAWYSIDQRSQYRQSMTFSCADGSLVSQGERKADTMEEDNILRSAFPGGSLTLLSETYDCSATCTPRLLRMVDAEGARLWELDAEQIGLSQVEGWFSTAQGALLYGRNVVKEPLHDQAVAMLIAPDGAVLWRYQANCENGSFRSAILDSRGRFLAVGMDNGIAQTDANGNFTGYPYRAQLLSCLNPATGEPYWEHNTITDDETLPFDNLLEYDGQYILCRSGSKYDCSIFETLDDTGARLQYWTTALPGYMMIAPQYFLWNGELWTRTIVKSHDNDIALERVALP